MPNNDIRYHVISRSPGWALKREGSSKATGLFRTQDEAVNESLKYQQKNHDVIVHRTDGTISEWRTGKS